MKSIYLTRAGQDAGAGGRVLRLRREPRPGGQGAIDARRAAEAFVEDAPELRARKRLTRDELLMALGAARTEAGRAWGLVRIQKPNANENVNDKTFSFELDKDSCAGRDGARGATCCAPNMRSCARNGLGKLPGADAHRAGVQGSQGRPQDAADLASTRRADRGAYLCQLFGLLPAHDAAQPGARVAGGLTTAAILEKLKAIQMIDVHLPTTDGRRIVMSRYTQPERDVALLLTQLRWTLPEQPRPRVQADGQVEV